MIVLYSTLGIKPEFSLRKAPLKLQFLLVQLYEFYEVILYGITVLAAISRSDYRLTPAEITRHAVAIQDSFFKTPYSFFQAFSHGTESGSSLHMSHS
jgi:hypothetical protein